MDEIGDVLGALYIYHIFGPLNVKPSMYARNNIEENKHNYRNALAVAE